MKTAVHTALICGVMLAIVGRGVAAAQDQQTADLSVPAEASPAGPALPPGYVIGADDVLSILFWGEKDMSAEVTVRPDGRVALPLLNELEAAGLTPDELRDRVITAARKFIENPNPTVMVKTINSRKVFITGQIGKPGTYPLNNPTSVLQLIAMAGGLRDFAKGKNISVFRAGDGRQVVLRFNYQEVLNSRNLDQNIDLRPGDTVVVP